MMKPNYRKAARPAGAVLLLAAFLSLACTRAEAVFVEAESFTDKGGWVLDNQAMAAMGSPYLLAHGLGVPVADASSVVSMPRSGQCRLWARTRDWCAGFGESPGRFMVSVNGEEKGPFGNEGAVWHWQDGGIVDVGRGMNEVLIHDLTGFDGRVDAFCLAYDLSENAPSDDALSRSRRNRPERGGNYDLVVAGGGIAGCCAAVSAARLGCRVALVQNRPVLGGNNSSEVRVGLSGLIAQKPYENLGYLLDELGGVGYWTNYEANLDPGTERSKSIHAVLEKHPEKHQHNAGPASNYEDGKKLALVEGTPGITLFLNTEVVAADCRGGHIRSIVGQNIENGRRVRIRGKLFADCTGDAALGYLAGADYHVGRESFAETGEPRAPQEADSLSMGTSVQWYSVGTSEPSPFPECPWALQFNETSCIPITLGEWDWEAGLERDQIYDIEAIRDHALRAVYGNWAYLKNEYSGKDAFACRKLDWVAYVGGKRESRRLVGDVLLKEQDILEGVQYDDASFTTTWGIDLHFPKTQDGYEGEPFLAVSDSPAISPYAVPYRCLYSRNIDNLFMAGRDISVTHVALGTVRVMRTGGMMGEVVGMAASVCRKHSDLPRDVYQTYLDELKALMEKGVGTPGFKE